MSTIPNPFWLFHNWFQNQCNQLCWWSEYNYGKNAVFLTVLSMVFGIGLIVIGVFLVEPHSAWFLGLLLGAPYVARSDFERQYVANTKSGFKNSLQKDWPAMVFLHIFFLIAAVVLFFVETDYPTTVQLLVVGTYFIVPTMIYLLATDPMPGNYEPGQRVRYARA